mmetsp:Transcript_9887/g.19901  ORF Transcript_9887/g.19901 Transcript_9887/m.19901 type:complete len:150 (+) Transcript_9887:223-672(+)
MRPTGWKYKCGGVELTRFIWQNIPIIMLCALLSASRASSALIGTGLPVRARSLAPNMHSGKMAHRFPVAFDLPKMRQPRAELKFFSSCGGDDYDDDEDEDEDEPSTSAKLERLEFKNYDIEHLRGLEERGKVQLQPFYHTFREGVLAVD